MRRLLDRLLGDESTRRRRLVNALSWSLSIPLRDRLDRPRMRLFRAVRPHTMVSYRRLANAWELCRRAEEEGRAGAFVECGVWRGGTAAVMASAARGERKTWLFDSFEGLPAPTAADGPDAVRWAGKCVAPVEEVERLLFTTLGLDRSRVIVRKGWFHETLPAARPEIGPIAVLRLDGDWYESTKACLEALYGSVVPGGWVILDDYGTWEGCRRAADGFLAARGEAPELRWIDASGAWWRKP